MRVLVRPARSADKAPLMSFIKGVWGGNDYIPRVWDAWIKDTRNRLYVVEADGVPVGMNRIRFLDDGSAWFEGARVHPRFRGRGLASMLGDNSMKVSKELGITTFRLTSGSRNRSAHRQISRIEFDEVARFSVYEPEKPGKADPRAAKVASGGGEEAIDLMRESEEFKLGHGVFWHDFCAAALTPAVVGRLVEEGAVWRLGEAVAVVGKGGGGSHAWEEVGFVGGPHEDALRLLKSVVGKNKGVADRWVFAPQGSPIISAMRKNGFRRWFSNILFERKAPKG